MSLQTGGEIAQTTRAVVDPARLQVLAYELAGPLLAAKPMLLRVVDVREFSDIGMIVDSIDELVEPTDVIKLDKIYRLQFNPVGMRVISTTRKAIGRVHSYTIDTEGFYIIQLAVKPTLLTRIREAELLIHRSQVREINDDAIVIEEREEVKEEPSLVPNASYINPFRQKTDPQPDATVTHH